MSDTGVGKRSYTGTQWAVGYAGFVAGLLLTALTFATGAFGSVTDKTTGVLVVLVPVALALVAFLLTRGGYRLVALGMVLAIPALWISVLAGIFTGGIVSSWF